jgi:hypothetical protein
MLKVGDNVRVLPSIVENGLDEEYIGLVGTVVWEDGTTDPLAEELDDQLVRVQLAGGEVLPRTLHNRFEKVQS